ncbi:MAG: phenylacetate--CoA ligase [Bacteroidales bacterium]|nr:phenylacetate--CoA ligase [Bacteroidales bacterium]
MSDNNKYWEKEIETMPHEELEALQLERLKKTITQASKSEYYGKLFKEKGLSEDSVNSVKDIKRFPFTTKEDLRGNYPFGFLACPRREAIRLHSSSGTTGNPTVVYHTKHDLEVWANLVARCMYMIGVRDTDVFQNTSGYGMFTAGLGFQYGAEKLGALTVPAGAGNTARQIKFIMDFGTTVIHAVPSYGIHLSEVFHDMGIDPRTQTKLTTFIIGAEPHTEEQRRRIENLMGVKAYNCFGMSEMAGPGVAFECPEQNGLHLWEDNYLIEIINPDTLEPVEDGEIGEMVLTTLNRTAMPLIRYRTRDLTRILPGPCPCGRTHVRIDRMKGRSDDMIIVKGVNIFPMQVEKILMQFNQLASGYLITIQPTPKGDEFIVEVELNDLFSDDYGEIEKLRMDVTRRLKDEILITPKVKLVQKGTIPRSEGKAVRVKDLRKLV